MNVIWKFILGLICVSAFASQDAPQTFTLDGRLYSDSDGKTAMIDGSILLKTQILNPAQDCILYEQWDTVSTTSTSGYFTIQVGAVVGDTSKRKGSDPGLAMSAVYSNTSGTVTGKLLSNGASCSYTPTAAASRYVRMQIQPSSDGQTRILSTMMALDSVPAAIVAERADNLQGYLPADFIQVSTTSPSANLTQSNVANIFSNTNYPRLVSLLNNGSSGYVQTGSNGVVVVPTVGIGSTSGLTSGQMWFQSGVLKYYDGSAIQTLGATGSGITSLVAGTGLTGGTITIGGQTIAVDVGTTSGQIVQVAAGNKLPAIDGSNLTNLNGASITGVISGSTSINTTGNIQTTGSTTQNRVFLYDHSGVGPGYIGIVPPNNIAGSGGSSYTLTLPDRAGLTGQMMVATTSTGTMGWSSASYPTTVSQNSLIYGSANNVLGEITAPTVPSVLITQVATNIPQWQTGTGNTFLKGGAGGVGFTSISLSTDVVGTLSTAQGGTGTTTPSNLYVMKGGQAGTFSLGTSDSTDLRFMTNGASQLTIGPTGNVGIGTTAPSTALDVAGNLLTYQNRIESSTPYLRFKKVDAAADEKLYFMGPQGSELRAWLANDSNGTQNDWLRVQRTGDTPAAVLFPNGKVGIGTTAPASALDVTGTVTMRSGTSSVSLDPNVNVNGSARTLRFSNYTTNSNEGFQFFNASSGSNLMMIQQSGNVGIGTTAPASRLEVKSASASSSPLLVTNSSGAGIFEISETAGSNGLLNVKTSGGTTKIRLQSAADSYFNGGNVGIGTSLPNRLLEVNGAIRIVASTSPASAAAGDIFIDSADGNKLKWFNGTSWQEAATSSGGSFSNVTSLSNNAGNISISAAAGTGTISITSGTASSSSTTGALVVDGGIGSNGNINAGGSISSGSTITATTSVVAGSGVLTPQIFGSTASGGAVRIDGTSHATPGPVLLGMGGGDVGIGTTAPGAKLEVAGVARANSFVVNTTGAATPNGMNAPTTNSLALWTNSTERLRIDSSGNVGIGMTTPQNALDVNGTIRATNFRISGALGLIGGGAGDTLMQLNGNYHLQNNTGATTYFSVTSAGRVGIGTSTPSRLLQIEGPIRITASTSPGSAAAGDIFIDSADGNKLKWHNGSSWQEAATSSSGSFSDVNSISNSTGNILLAPVAGTGTVSVTGGTASTNSTTGALVVTGGAGISGALNTGGAIASGSTITATTSVVAGSAVLAPQVYGSTAASGDVRIDGTSHATSGNVLLATAGGKVGIGTTAPSAPFMVSYSATNGTTNPYIFFSNALTTTSDGDHSARNLYNRLAVKVGSGHIESGDFTANEMRTLRNNSGNSDNGSVTGQLIGNSIAYGHDDSDVGATPSSTMAIGLKVMPYYRTGTVNTMYDIYLSADSTGGTVNSHYGIFQANTARNYLQGSVGIGTTAPSYKLHVRSTDGEMAVQDSDSNISAVGAVTSVRGLASDGNAEWILGDTSTADNDTSLTVRNRLAIVTNSGSNSTPNILIDTNGNVGIGTTTPGRLLQVAGPMRLTASTSPSGAVAGDMFIDSADGNRFKYFDGTSWVAAGSTSATSFSGITSIANAGGDITLSPVASSGRVYIDSGTASTLSSNGALVVSGGAGISGDVNTGGSIYSGGGISAATSGWIPQLYGSSSAGGNIRIDGTSNASKGNVYLASAGGKVGVGMTNPTSLLDISDSPSATSGLVRTLTNNLSYWPGSASTAVVQGQYFGANSGSANVTGATLMGSQAEITYSGTGASNLGGAVAQQGNVTNTSSGSIGTAYGVKGIVDNTGTGTIWGAYGLHSKITNTGGGTVAEAYGLYIDTISGTAKYGIYQSDSTNKNYFAGSVGIGTTTPHSTALLDLSSTTKGFAPPRMSAAQRTSISSPAESLIVFDTDDHELYIYKSSAWRKMSTITEVAFSAYQSAAQSIPNNSLTAINWQSEDFDTDAAMNLATDQFLPTKSGYYYIGTEVRMDQMSDQDYSRTQVYKNGTIVSTCQSFVSYGAAGDLFCYTGTVVYLNGSTDYVEVKVIHNHGSSRNTVAGLGSSNFSGFLISGGAGGGSGGTDNLGNHVATQNLSIINNWISSDGDAEGIRIDGSGNVGIGITTPGRLLTVNGAMRMIASTSPTGTATAGDIYVDSADSNKLKWYNGSSWQSAGGASGGLTGVTSVANSGGDITLSPVASSGRVYIDSGTASTLSSNGALVVSGGAGISGDVNAAGTVSAANFSATTNAWIPQIYGSSLASGNIRIDGTSNATKGNVYLASAGGKVGIGTTVPTGLLHVMGGASGSDVYTETNDGTTSANLYAKSDGNQIFMRAYGSSNGAVTSDSVSLADAVALWGESTSTRMVVGTNGNLPLHLATNYRLRATITGAGDVGIGTTNPPYKLTVAGGATAGYFTTTDYVAGATGSGLAIQIGAGTGNTYSNIGAYSSGGTVSNNLVLQAGGGSVGIGTTNPQNELHVHDSGGTTADIRISQATSGATSVDGLLLRSTGTDANVNNLESGFLSFATNGGERMRILPTGSVGIGTTSANHTLEVSGDIYANNISDANQIGKLQIGYSGSNNPWIQGVGGIIRSNSQIEMYTSARSIVGRYPGELSLAQSRTGYDITFATSPATDEVYVEAMRIKSSGYVGIGTTAPGRLLTVAGPMRVIASTSPTGTAVPGDMYVDSADSNKLKWYDGSSWQTAGGASGGLTGVTSVANSGGDITLSPVASSGRVYIDSGTASTLSSNGALVVSGGAGISGDINTGGSIYSSGALSAATSLWAPQIYGSSSASGNIRIDGTSNATKGNVFLASAGGYVGVGTSNPTVPLHIQKLSATNSTSTLFIAEGTDNGNTGSVKISDGATTGYLPVLEMTSAGIGTGIGPFLNVRIPAADDTFFNGYGALNIDIARAGGGSVTAANLVSINNNGVPKFLVNKDGYVGIGTNTPNAMIHAHNAGGAKSEFFATTGGTGATASDGVGFGINTGAAWVWNNEATPLQFATSNAERMRIDASGNVGIGTTAPANGTLTVVSSPTGGLSNIMLGKATAVSGSEAASLTLAGNGIQHAGFSWVPNSTTNNSRLSIAMGGDADAGTNPALVSFMGSGNVGIGTTVPVVKLDVRGGNINFDYGSAIMTGMPNGPTSEGGNNTWSGGTSKLIATGWNGSADFVNYYTPGSLRPTPVMTMLSSGKVGIGTTSPASALDVTSTTSGFLPPRMTTTQKDAISPVTDGMIVYDTTVGALYVYEGSWKKIAKEEPVIFRVHRNGVDQTLAGSSVTNIDWTTTTYDTKGWFNLSTDRYTPQEAGYYQFTLVVSIQDLDLTLAL